MAFRGRPKQDPYDVIFSRRRREPARYPRDCVGTAQGLKWTIFIYIVNLGGTAGVRLLSHSGTGVFLFTLLRMACHLSFIL